MLGQHDMKVVLAVIDTLDTPSTERNLYQASVPDMPEVAARSLCIAKE